MAEEQGAMAEEQGAAAAARRRRKIAADAEKVSKPIALRRCYCDRARRARLLGASGA